MDYEELLAQLHDWHDNDEYARIIERIQQIPVHERSYGLISQLARAYNNDERYREAIQQLLSIADDGKQDPLWHFRLGFAYHHLALYDQALHAFREANRLQPGDEDTLDYIEYIRPKAEKMIRDQQRCKLDAAIWKQNHGSTLPFEGFDLASFWRGNEYARATEISEQVDAAVVRSIEQELGYKIPAAYIALMESQNGGTPSRTSFPTEEATSWAEDHIAITDIHGIRRDRSHSFGGGLGSRFMIEEWGYPDLGIVICDCPSAGHDVVMLDYRLCGPEGEPSVVHVDQEDDYEITYLAPNFEAFIRGLVDDSVFDEGDEGEEIED